MQHALMPLSGVGGGMADCW